MPNQHRYDRLFGVKVKRRLELYFLIIQIFYAVYLRLSLIRA